MKNLSKSTGIVVLGMHRSGTSALSGLLSKAGFNMGRDLFGPQAGVNDQGFFENAGGVAINERLLDSLGAQWDQPQALNLTSGIPGNEQAIHDIRHFLLDEYHDSPYWGLKDPRCVLLEPLWRAAIERCGGSVQNIIICRHPLEVADSLARRDKFNVHKSLALWLNYNFRCLDAAAKTDSVIVTFASLIREPDITLARISDGLGLSLLKGFKAGGFIENKLYRSKKSDASDSSLAGLAEAVYAEMATGAPCHTTLAQLRGVYDDYQGSLDPALLNHLARISRSEIHFRHLFYEAYDSWWWKLAALPRWLERKIRRAAFQKAPPRH